MSKIFCIVGKSASGKDTVYKAILEEKHPELIPVVPYTTRPMRSGEKDGVDYYFVTQKQLEEFEKDNQIIERREYHTTQGLWTYFTRTFVLEDGCDYIMITTLEGAKGIMETYGADKVHLICLAIDDKTRLLRCIEREARQARPNYEEVCRRFLADQKDFSEENIGIFKNLHVLDNSGGISDCVKKWDDLYKTLRLR